MEVSAMESKKTSTGLDENIAGALTYLLGWVTGIIFLMVEKENRFVRFHAWQSIITTGALTILFIILGVIPVLGWILSIILAPLTAILWLWLMYKAFQGEMYKLPWVGDFAEKQLGAQ